MEEVVKVARFVACEAPAVREDVEARIVVQVKRRPPCAVLVGTGKTVAAYWAGERPIHVASSLIHDEEQISRTPWP
jgi:predicted hydrocarbon binding protein